MVFGAVGTAAKKMAGTLQSTATILGQALVVGAGMSIAKTIEYNDTLRAAGARARTTARGLKVLDERARELGRTTSFTATEVARLMMILGQSGFKVGEITTITEDVMNLSRATGAEVELAAKLLGNTMGIFKMETTDAGRIASVFTGTVNRTRTNIENLAEGWKFAAKEAHNFGMDMEETAAIMGTLAQMGLEGSIAGTAVRRIATLSAVEAEAIEKDFGIAFKKAGGEMKSLLDIMDEISKATDELASPEKMTKFYEAFGLRGVTAASGLADESVGTKQLLAELRAVGDEAAITAKKMDAGIGGAWRRLKSAIEGVALTIGDVMSPGVILAMDKMKNAMNSFTDWMKDNWKSVTEKMGEVLVTFMAYIKTIFGDIDTSIQILSGRMEQVKLLLVKSALGPVAGAALQKDYDRLNASNERLEAQMRKNAKALAAAYIAELREMIDSMNKVPEGPLQEGGGPKVEDPHAGMYWDEKRGMWWPNRYKRREATGDHSTGIAGAQMRGSSEALLTILNAGGARTDEMQLAIQKKQLNEEKAQAEWMKKIANKPSVEINVVDAP